MNIVKKKTGFTLVEVIVVTAILVILAMLMVGQLNPIQLIAKANDSRRKKDLATIKVAFEEYYNDKGCYPSGVTLTNLMDASNCTSTIFKPWLGTWPCDPVSRQPYYIYVGTGDVVDNTMECPHWYKILGKLENQKDASIPNGWYGKSTVFGLGDGSLKTSQVNTGISSDNVKWFDAKLNPKCVRTLFECYALGNGGNWQALPYGQTHYNAYTVRDTDCFVDCCINGLPCNY